MITPGVIEGVRDQVQACGLNEAAIAMMRRHWPGISFTLCSEDDVPARLSPYATDTGFDIYLVSGAEHCVAFTERFEAATGLVLAARDE